MPSTKNCKNHVVSLSNWLVQFPEFALNDLYIAGESYAGIYVPTMAEQILSFPLPAPAPKINLAGLAIGDGCIGHHDIPHR